MLSPEELQTNKKILYDNTNNKKYIKGKEILYPHPLGKLLGTGGFAKCYEAIDQSTDRLYAAKVIPKKSINEKRQRYKLLIEIKLHRSLKHKNIVEFLDAFEDKENIYILLEYCRNYTLKDLVKRRKRLTEHETRMYTTQVVKALIYIHKQGVIHRDLKLGNILINDQMEAKICDFGLSTRVKTEGEIKKTICGTPNYIAPEILEENGHSYEVDIWSIGVIMFTLLFGKPPFEDNTVEQTYENIKNNRYVYPASVRCSLEAKDLINRVLVVDPAKRLGLEEILEHEFMKVPEGFDVGLPVSSLAVPPGVEKHERYRLEKQQSQPLMLNLNDVQLEESEEISEEDDDGDENEPSEENGYNQSNHLEKHSSPNQDSKNCPKQSLESSSIKPYANCTKFSLPFVAIREVFLYEGCYGYLLTNGIVGMFIKKLGVNMVLEFGQQNYYIIPVSGNGQRQKEKPSKQQLQQQKLPVPSEYQPIDTNLERLLHFKAFYSEKYSLFKLGEMNKRGGGSINDGTVGGRGQGFSEIDGNGRIPPPSSLPTLVKCFNLTPKETMTRLSNSVIQIHFADFTSLIINRDDEKGLYYINKKGRYSSIKYNELKNVKLKVKIRRFSNIMQRLEGEEEDDEEKGDGKLDGYGSGSGSGSGRGKRYFSESSDMINEHHNQQKEPSRAIHAEAIKAVVSSEDDKTEAVNPNPNILSEPPISDIPLKRLSPPPPTFKKEEEENMSSYSLTVEESSSNST